MYKVSLMMSLAAMGTYGYVMERQGHQHGCLELGTAMPHNDVRVELHVPSWQECDQHCMEEDQCSFWTYREKKNKCFLKSSDANRKVSTGAVSGTKGCSAACPGGMQLNTDENINNNEQRCIPCSGGSISNGYANNGGCTDCSLGDLTYANVEQTACIAACPNDMPSYQIASYGKQCTACPDGLGVIAPSSKCNTCPGETPLTAVDGITCLSTCPAEQALSAQGASKCVVACPADHYMSGTPLACVTDEYNSGEYNSGEYNSGEYNSGEYNSGEYNSGEYNSGEYDSSE